jgi:flavin reductase (DIM6/NTAB) family NADH-FMN oxidoreductase RutF
VPALLPAAAEAPPADFQAASRFRDAMARLAGGVAVAACLDRGEPRGLLVSSIASLSLEPQQVLFCVRKAARAHDALMRAERASLSILAEEDRAEAERFFRPELAGDRFRSVGWRMSSAEPPRYEPALIGLAGPLRSRIDAGSHTIFVLEAERVESRPARPLIAFDRDLVGLEPAVFR